MTDDQGYGDLGVHGNTMIRTPNLDKLHGESIRLTDFHVDPYCAPTRAALMTGRYATRTGVWDTIWGRSLAARDEVMLPELLADAGYATAMFGKWHLGDNYPFRPEDKGFQHVVRHGGGGVGQSPDYWGNDYFDDTYWANGELTQYDGYTTDVWFGEALQFIEDNKDKPFFAYISTNAPHGPFFVDEKYAKPYADQGVISPMAEFYGMIENIDENMGRLDEKLAELGLRENTIVIFMTDNGTAVGVLGPLYEFMDVPDGAWPGFAAGMRGAKGSEYEGGHRVPFFIRWPAGRLGEARDIPTLTAHIDVLPTLVEFAGAQPPAVLDIDGESLAPILREEGGLTERTLFTHHQARMETPVKWRKSAVMTERWRLVNGVELYDIQADPAQANDIAAAHPVVVEELRKAYNQWWNHIDDRFYEDIAIPIGEEENPARLTAHDWRPIDRKDGAVIWRHYSKYNFSGVEREAGLKTNPQTNGVWVIEVAEPGEYEFELFQWDKPAEKVLDATTASIEIGAVSAAADVPAGAQSVSFRMDLPKGKTTMQTWLKEAGGAERGAFYVYAKKL